MIDTPQNILEQIKEALFKGRKIDAIRLYREARGVGLKEAKEDVEKLERELRERSPEAFSAPAAKGCLSVVAALAATLSLVLTGLLRLLAG